MSIVFVESVSIASFTLILSNIFLMVCDYVNFLLFSIVLDFFGNNFVIKKMHITMVVRGV
ncbi:Uncharacterised protein [Chlamydia trachomatis]|nr:Uncharacterised protein [Chlamydia trachomatis]